MSTSDVDFFFSRYPRSGQYNDIILVQIYVDDIIFGSSNAKLCKDLVKAMQGEFEMSMMGELSFFLGLQVKQSKYCKDILKKFEMKACKSTTTHMSTNCYLGADEVGPAVDQTKYWGLIGSLLYLTTSRPNIMFVVCLCARFQCCPKESHLKVAKRILKYLNGTISMGLWYPSHSHIHLVGYSDSDFAGCKLDRKSTSGTCHLLGSSLISWHSKKQACVALSTAEAEYIAIGSCCAQILWSSNNLKTLD
ncbi:secreted RxLR effector protein 161-like [Phaseolus vulgaris]|uniref:secreted RxLR effector protein 161-like n=1 Tax=Phaseolus vulgaris TaxID=3885 RepID=UPI0035C99930